MITPTANKKSYAIEANRLQTILGTLLSLDAKHVRLVVSAGKLHRITLPRANDFKVVVDGSSLDLVSPGDEVVVKGHIYSGKGSIEERTIFGSEISVTKVTL